MYTVFPEVKKMVFREGAYKKPTSFHVFFGEELENAFKALEKFLIISKSDLQMADIVFEKSELPSEAYLIKVLQDKIIIEYSDSSGAYYATKILSQIFNQTSDDIRLVEIYDEPDLKIRGLLLDISRDKIPTLETLFELIDIMSDLKMNHLELYVEGFSFGYPSFKQYWADKTPITVDDYKCIETYCRNRCIDLVPNQNGFGHMADWLEKEEFAHLAECPEGIYLWGSQRPASTLNPLDEGSFELVKKMYADMLPISKSNYFNMNFDEPFELGKGKSKQAVEERGLGNVYVDYVLKAYDEIKKYGKTPLIWGDVLIKHPEVLDRLPKDMIFIDWGYDGFHPFSENLKLISEKNIKFMSAPGTTSWCSGTGRSLDMIMNIYNACLYTKLYGGEGSLLTDWGDFGHLQYLPISFVPLAYFGLLSWRVQEGVLFKVKHFVNRFIFKDSNNLMADLMLDLGSYNKLENGYMSNGTQTFYSFIWAEYALMDKNPLEYYTQKMKYNHLSIDQFTLLSSHFDEIIKKLEYTKMLRNDAELIKAEIKQTIDLLTNIQKLILSFNNDIDICVRVKYLKELISSENRLIENHRSLWLARNRIGGLDDSLSHIKKFVEFSKLKLEDLQNRGEVYENKN